MAKFTAAFAIVCGVLFVYGFISEAGKDRLKLSKLEERRKFTLIVSAPDVTDTYRWLQVYGCSAYISETAGVECDPTGWFSSSLHPMRADQKQYPIPYLNLPGGTIHFTAFARDAYANQIAQAQLTVLRAY